MAGPLPVLKKACFCLPLEHGLVAYGILRMIVTVIGLFLLFLAYFCENDLQCSSENTQEYGSLFKVVFGILISLLILDVLFNFTMAIGVIMRDANLLKISCGYAIVPIVTICLVGSLMVSLQIYLSAAPGHCFLDHVYMALLYIAITIVLALIHFYIFLLIRSCLIKVTKKSQISFINLNDDSKCPLVIEKQ